MSNFFNLYFLFAILNLEVNMKRIINELEKEIEDLKKIEYVLKQLKLWFACKKNSLQVLPEYEINNLEKMINKIDLNIKIKYPELMNIIYNYLQMIKIPNYELEEILDKKKK